VAVGIMFLGVMRRSVMVPGTVGRPVAIPLVRIVVTLGVVAYGMPSAVRAVACAEHFSRSGEQEEAGDQGRR